MIRIGEKETFRAELPNAHEDDTAQPCGDMCFLRHMKGMRSQRN